MGASGVRSQICVDFFDTIIWNNYFSFLPDLLAFKPHFFKIPADDSFSHTLIFLAPNWYLFLYYFTALLNLPKSKYLGVLCVCFFVHLSLWPHLWCSGVTIWDVEYRAMVVCMQGKQPNNYIITLTPQTEIYFLQFLCWILCLPPCAKDYTKFSTPIATSLVSHPFFCHKISWFSFYSGGRNVKSAKSESFPRQLRGEGSYSVLNINVLKCCIISESNSTSHVQ